MICNEKNEKKEEEKSKGVGFWGEVLEMDFVFLEIKSSYEVVSS